MHKFMVMWMKKIRRLYNRQDNYASVAFVVMSNGSETNTNQFGTSFFRLDFMSLPPCGSMYIALESLQEVPIWIQRATSSKE